MAGRPELLVQAAFSLATGLLYAYVARLVLSRRATGPARFANALFAAWWMCLGIVSGLSATFNLPGAFGIRDLALTITITNIFIVVLVAGAWALIGYLLYLYLGHARWLVPLTVAYAVYAALFLYAMSWLQPNGFVDPNEGLRMSFTHELPQWALLGLSLGLSLPVLVAAFAYGTLYFRVDGAAQRYRVAMVSGGFVLWFGWSLVSSITGISRRFGDTLGLRTVNHALALLVPLLVILAYRPLPWARRRFGLEAVQAESRS